MGQKIFSIISCGVYVVKATKVIWQAYDKCLSMKSHSLLREMKCFVLWRQVPRIMLTLKKPSPSLLG